MSKKEQVFEVGQIIKNPLGQYTKILSVLDNRYGLSGWSNLPSAKKANVVTTFLNIFGLENCEAEITDEVADETEDTPTSSEAVTKKSLKAMSVEELTELAGTLSIEIDEADKKGDILEKLFVHYEL